ncbi:MAG: hypothetical protein ACSHX0_04890 [Akkermansiaceae bacterium]
MNKILITTLLLTVRLVAEPAAEPVDSAELIVDTTEKVSEIMEEISDEAKKLLNAEELDEGVVEDNNDEPVMITISDLNPSLEDDTEQSKSNDGIEVQVELSGVSDGEEINSNEVVITAPWPAKPQPAPAGWEYTPAPESLENYSTNVKLSGGKSIDLSITPLVLVPTQDGISALRISEPGYNSEQYLNQTETVGALLEALNIELAEKEIQAAKSINNLQQLLSSLPK